MSSPEGNGSYDDEPIVLTPNGEALTTDEKSTLQHSATVPASPRPSQVDAYEGYVKGGTLPSAKAGITSTGTVITRQSGSIAPPKHRPPLQAKANFPINVLPPEVVWSARRRRALDFLRSDKVRGSIYTLLALGALYGGSELLSRCSSSPKAQEAEAVPTVAAESPKGD